MKDRKLIPYATILAAKKGDPDAMKMILDHYDKLVNFYSQRTLFDEYGNTYIIVDPEIKERINAKIMYRVVYKFNPYKLPDGETLEE